MSLRKSVFGECHDASIVGESAGTAVDQGRLAERLLLFERVVFKSDDLRELPSLINVLGCETLTRLLNQDAFAICRNLYGIGDFNQPPFRYRIQAYRIEGSPQKPTRSAEQIVDGVKGLGRVERGKLVSALERRLIRIPDKFLETACEHLERDTRADIPSIRTGAVMAAKSVANVDLPLADVKLTLHPEGDGNYRAETNLDKHFNRDMTHEIIRKAVLAVAETEQKLEEMIFFNSICEFRASEVVMLQEKVQFAWEEQQPGQQVARLNRLLRLKEFPDFSLAATREQLDFAKLVEVRNSDECQEFRRWLSTIDERSDEELAKQMASILPALRSLTSSGMGKLLRFATTTVAGLLPGIGTAAGTAASGIDGFLIDRVLKSAGPLAFLDDAVGSILRDKR